MREHTTDLALGVGKLRWSDSESDAKKIFTSTKASLAYEGRSPRTGAKVSVAPGLIIPGFWQMGPTHG